MRIIVQGKLPEEQVYDTTCRNCNTQFEFARKEARFQPDQRDGDCLVIPCPLCKKELYVAL